MPLGLKIKIKIGQPNVEEEAIQHNRDCKNWEEGYKEAIDELEKWRDEEIKKLIQ